MNHIVLQVSRSKDLYGVHTDALPGIYGAGKTMAEAKASFLEAWKLYSQEQPNHELAMKKWMPFELEWQLDVESFLSFYGGIFSKAGLERLTGINQKLLSHYGTGLKKPRLLQRKKLEKALHQLGDELKQISLT